MPPKVNKKKTKRDREGSSDDSFSNVSPDDIDAIVKRAVSEVLEAFAQFKAEMLHTLSEKMAVFRNELDIIGAENEVLKTNVEALRANLKQQSTAVSEANEQIAALNKKMNDCVKAANSNEQYSRRFSLRVHGIKFKQNENCVQECV